MPKDITICPRCGSRNVSVPMGKAVSSVFVCGNCGFSGPLFPQVSPEEARISDRNSIKISKFKDTKKARGGSFISKLIALAVILAIIYAFIILMRGGNS